MELFAVTIRYEERKNAALQSNLELLTTNRKVARTSRSSQKQIMRPPRRHIMSELYPRFFLDLQLAKRRCAQIFEATRDVDSDSLSAPNTRTALGTTGQDLVGKRQAPAQGTNQSGNILRDFRRNQRRWERPDRTNSDMSAFSFTLTLQVLGTIAAAHTDRPVFWLLVGPMPLAIGFTLITFVRKGVFRFNRKSRGVIGREFSETQQQKALGAPCAASNGRKIMRSEWSSCAAY